ncbi:hypothetical protein Vafri_12473 [Volvox africanus]|uniref:Uncharacterized protein n=1 Tax=Volvox africanus TaxID=51714 RepID=A0A8J4F5D2_9CHLO|nr:hypothetical protein Vafri_12473 [Volvox africanus]
MPQYKSTIVSPAAQPGRPQLTPLTGAAAGVGGVGGADADGSGGNGVPGSAPTSPRPHPMRVRSVTLPDENMQRVTSRWKVTPPSRCDTQPSAPRSRTARLSRVPEPPRRFTPNASATTRHSGSSTSGPTAATAASPFFAATAASAVTQPRCAKLPAGSSTKSPNRSQREGRSASSSETSVAGTSGNCAAGAAVLASAAVAMIEMSVAKRSSAATESRRRCAGLIGAFVDEGRGARSSCRADKWGRRHNHLVTSLEFIKMFLLSLLHLN